MFNTWGTSSEGAQGVLQLMPRTASLMARDLGLRYNPGLLTGNPDYNIRLGSHYMKTLLDRYGEPALAVAAYNAGPGRVDEWLRLHGDPRTGDRYALIDWVELIPFDETRNYVQRVLEGRNMYRRRLADPEVATVWFRPVNGPLDPVPAPAMKPRDQARAVQVAALVAGAPRPALKPQGRGLVVMPAGFEAPPRPKLKPREDIEVAARGVGSSSLPPAKPVPELVTAARMTGIRACVFDAYGTLFDVHSAVGRLRARIGDRADALSQLWRTKQLEYSWLRALMGRHADFWRVTGDALDHALAKTGADPDLRAPLLEAYLTLDAYPEVPDVLRRLRAGGLKTAILSNGEPEMLAAGARSAGIDGLLDGIFSVEEVGIFKPAPARLPARGRATGRGRGRDRLPVLERLGRPRRGLLRVAAGLDQPVRRPARAPARRAGIRARGPRGPAGAARPLSRFSEGPARGARPAEFTGRPDPAKTAGHDHGSQHSRPSPTSQAAARAPAGGRGPHAAARIRGAQRAGRRPRPAQGRDPAADRLVQVPRRLQRDQPARGAAPWSPTPRATMPRASPRRRARWAWPRPS